MAAATTHTHLDPPRFQTPPPPKPGALRSSNSKPPLRYRRRVWLFRGFVAAMISVSLIADPASWLIVPLLFVLVVPFEKCFPRHDQRLRRKHVGLDVAYALSQPALGAITLFSGAAVAIVSLLWLPGLVVRPVVVALPPIVQTIVAFLIFDLIVYWVHRWSHEVPFLWRFHSIHHSIETMDWVSAFRNHPIDGLIIAPAVAFMIGAGFPLETTGIITVIQIATGIFLHANVRWRWRPIQRLVITPDFHHWHHANETEALNSNYSIFLPGWDMLFGTWYMPPDRRPSVYGVDEAVPTAMAAQMTYPFAGLERPVWMFRHPVLGGKKIVGMIASGLGQMVASARRQRRPVRTPRHSSPSEVTSG